MFTVERIRTILETTFAMPVSEGDAKYVLDRFMSIFPELLCPVCCKEMPCQCEKPHLPSEDDILADDESKLCSVCGNPLEPDGECLLCDRNRRPSQKARDVVESQAW